MITIDARRIGGGFNYEAYLTDYFEGLPQGSSDFRGGAPDVAFGSEFWMNGPQIAFSYSESDKLALFEGEELAYDFIHHGPQFGHGITGFLDSVTFAQVDEDTSTKGEHGVYRGLDKGLIISGLGLTAEPGAGPVETNDVYWLYKAMQTAGIDVTKFDVFDQYFFGDAQLFKGSAGDDVFTGSAFDDTLNGGNGLDSLSGANGNDVVNGQTGNDWLAGGKGNDVINGSGGDDVIKGQAGDDTIVGAAGSDTLFGNSGNDTFLFGKNAVGGTDVIRDFAAGDAIDVSALDLTSVGSAPFTGTGVAELAYGATGDGSTAQVDLDGDGTSDLSIVVRGHLVTDSDFIF